MYTVFRSPTLTTRRNIQQENNILAKKPGSQSVRKPLGERSVNVSTNQTPSGKLKQTPKIQIKNNEPTEDFSDPSFYKNSYKDIKDTYNDLLSERDVLGRKGRENIRKKFLYENDVNEPILRLTQPKSIEIKPEYKLKMDDYDFNFNMNINDFNLGLNEVPLPIIEF